MISLGYGELLKFDEPVKSEEKNELWSTGFSHGKVSATF